MGVFLDLKVKIWHVFDQNQRRKHHFAFLKSLKKRDVTKINLFCQVVVLSEKSSHFFIISVLKSLLKKWLWYSSFYLFNFKVSLWYIEHLLYHRELELFSEIQQKFNTLSMTSFFWFFEPTAILPLMAWNWDFLFMVSVIATQNLRLTSGQTFIIFQFSVLMLLLLLGIGVEKFGGGVYSLGEFWVSQKLFQLSSVLRYQSLNVSIRIKLIFGSICWTTSNHHLGELFWLSKDDVILCLFQAPNAPGAQENCKGELSAFLSHGETL